MFYFDALIVMVLAIVFGNFLMIVMYSSEDEQKKGNDDELPLE